MSILTDRNYGRAVSTRTVPNIVSRHLGETRKFETHASLHGKKVALRVTFETAVHENYRSWKAANMKDLTINSQRFDAAGLRWNQLYDESAPRRTKAFSAHFKRLQEIRVLKQGWDSYDATPPTETACDLATTLLGKLEQCALPVAYITATSDSSIMVNHAVNGSSVTWEFDPDGEIGVMVERPRAATRFLSPGSQEIGSLVEELSRDV